MMEVKKAKREKLKVPIMITGASGSGKTVSALMIAKGIVEKMFPKLTEDEQWEKIGVIDTEHKRALLYAGSTIDDIPIGEFLHLDFEPPYNVRNYITAFDLMKQSGVEVVIVDSMSHAWSGEGGILEQVEKISGGNSNKNMLAWKQVKPMENEFLKLITGNSVYVIATSRSKQAYDFEKGENGKTKIVKMGLKPDQKDALEYEFAIALRIDQEHMAEATKDNSNMFELPFKITPEIGHKIFDWSDKGIDLEATRKEMILDVLALREKSEKHAKTYDELLTKLKGKKIDDLSIKLLERMKELLENIQIQEEVQEESLFDVNNPPTNKQN